MNELKCVNCKKIIHFPNRKTQKYCNELCLVEYKKKTKYHRKFAKPLPKQVNCVVCNLPFKRKHGRKLTCSVKCFNYRKNQSYEMYKGLINVRMTLEQYRKWRNQND